MWKRYQTKKRNRGSATIEIVCMLPFVICALLIFYHMGKILITEEHIYAALEQTALEVSENSYLFDVEDEDLDISNPIVKNGVQYAVNKSVFNKYLANEREIEEYVKNGKNGFSFEGSGYSEDGNYLDLQMGYTLQIQSAFLPAMELPVHARAHVHVWTGNRMDDKEEEYVYITPHQSVYHKDRNCTHLRLAVHVVSGKTLETLGKYAPCALCGERVDPQSLYYITDDGDRYHTTAACSGLKRTVYRIKRTEVSGKKACSRCGGK